MDRIGVYKRLHQRVVPRHCVDIFLYGVAMTNLLKYVHTHGKVKRCWHEVTQDPQEESDMGVCILCEAECGWEWGEGEYRLALSHPTPTIDYFIQRCEEEGLDWEITRDGVGRRVHVGERINEWFMGGKDEALEAIALATARALGWEDREAGKLP